MNSKNWKTGYWISAASRLYRNYKKDDGQLKWQAFLSRLRELREEQKAENEETEL